MKRRDVLKGLAGAAALCALPASLRAAPTTARGYAAGRFGLMLDGAFVGLLESAEGGGASADVIVEPKSGAVARKHLGTLRYDEIVLAIGAAMGKGVYDWIKGTVDRKPVAKSGALVSLDTNFAAQSSLEFERALLTEIGMPALDAGSKEPASMTIKLAPEYTRAKKGDGSKVDAGGAKASAARWLQSNFRLTIGGLEDACKRVNKIEALTIKQRVTTTALGEGRTATKEPASIEIPNLAFTVPESFASQLQDWHQDFVIKGNNAQDRERTGTLEYMGPDQRTLITVRFSGLGIFRLGPEKVEAGSEAIRRVRAELYCEEMRFEAAAPAKAPA